METLEAFRPALENLCADFGLGPPLTIKGLPGTRNLNFKVETPHGAWVLRRRFSGYCEPSRLEFDRRALEFLAGKGVPVVPCLRSPHPTLFPSEEGLWEVSPFIEGSPLAEGDPAHLHALAEALAHYHAAGADFPRRLEKLGPRGETDPKVLLSQADEILRTSTGAESEIARYRDWVIQAAEALPDSLFFGLPHTLIHGDIQPANLLIREGRLVAFLDLDWCGWQARVYDLAYAFLFCCSTHPSPIEGGDIWSLTQPPIPRPELFADFLEAYREAGASLSREERAALPAQITLTWCHCRLAGALKVTPKERAGFLARPPHAREELVYSIL